MSTTTTDRPKCSHGGCQTDASHMLQHTGYSKPPQYACHSHMAVVAEMLGDVVVLSRVP